MTLRTEYAELAIERERVARKLARPSLADRITRAWFKPAEARHVHDPQMFVWRDVADVIPIQGE